MSIHFSYICSYHFNTFIYRSNYVNGLYKVTVNLLETMSDAFIHRTH